MPGSPDFKYNRMLSDIISSRAKPPVVPDTGWVNIGVSSAELQNIPFQDDWDNATPTSDNPPASFYHSIDGEVRFRGVVSKTSNIESTDDSVIFYLPDEALPEHESWFMVPVKIGTSGAHIVDLNHIRFRSWEE